MIFLYWFILAILIWGFIAGATPNEYNTDNFPPKN